jgi:PAS domain S-box-containing protein
MDPFVLFLLAVVACARFLGFGPAVLAALLSVFVIDYVVFEPRYRFSTSPLDIAWVCVFLVISLLAASVARQRSRAELQADETRRRLADIVESSHDAIYSTTLDGVVTSWNRSAEQLYGYPAAEITGKSWKRAIPPERTDEFHISLGHLQRGEAVPPHKTERIRKDGSRVHVLLSLSPLLGRNGQVVGASAIARDITAQQKAEEALRRSEKLANAGRLTAVIAHEINNPLEAITNLLYLARQDPQNADQHLQMAEREVQRIADIVQQTLGFVRDIGSGDAVVHVSATVDEVIQRHLPRLQAKKIEPAVELTRDDQIPGSAGELSQLFSNLVGNAVDALSEGGKLRVRVSRLRDRNGHSGLRVIVADNGTGIRSEDMNRIFEPFFTTKRQTGTGLGLWVSEGIVRRHGGSIRLRTTTRPGRSGTAFMVFLPDREPRAA